MAKFLAKNTETNDGTTDLVVDMGTASSITHIVAESDASAGTVTLFAKARGSSLFEKIYDADGVTQSTINLADPESVIVNNAALIAIKFVFSGMAGQTFVNGIINSAV